MSSMLKVLRQRDFGLLWFAGLISMTGNLMLFIALPITVYELTGSALATSGVLIVRLVPSLLLGSVAGVFVDRWDRKRTMVIADLVRAPVLLLLLTVDSSDQIWIIYVVGFVVSTIGQFFGPAENALLPLLVGEEHLVTANALNALNNNLARLLGPAAGGLLVAWFGLGGVALVDGASFLLSALMIASIVTAAKAERSRDSGDAARGALHTLLQEWLSGVRLIRANPTLRVVFGIIAIASVGEGVMGTAFWVYVDEALHGGSREAGWLMSAQAIGGLAGGVIVGSWWKSASPIRLLGWGAIFLGLIDLMTFNYPTFISGVWLGIFFMAIVGIPATAFVTGYSTTMQTESEDAYRGRLFGALNTTAALLAMVGAGIAGFATGRLGSVPTLTLQSLAYVAAGAFGLAMLGRRSLGRIPVEQLSADSA
jgi:MFS family permease